MRTGHTSKKPLAVGAKVRFKFGGRDVVATIIEDRGPLGVDGVQILRVRLELAGINESMEFEVPATDVSVAA
jgi:hypothetical protein